jgi:CheY-like chemotaxis protein
MPKVTVCLPTLNESVGAPKSAQTDRSVSTMDLPAESTGNRPTRVLIIEDNQDAAECLQLLLGLFGYQVKIAYDGSSGLTKAHSFMPDIILCDIGLPGGMDGYEVARTIRQDSALKDIYLIAMTGYGQDEDKRHAFDAGFNEHITKPADPLVLEKMLKAVPVVKR